MILCCKTHINYIFISFERRGGCTVAWHSSGNSTIFRYFLVCLTCLSCLTYEYIFVSVSLVGCLFVCLYVVYVCRVINKVGKKENQALLLWRFVFLSRKVSWHYSFPWSTKIILFFECTFLISLLLCCASTVTRCANV